MPRPGARGLADADVVAAIGSHQHSGNQSASTGLMKEGNRRQDATAWQALGAGRVVSCHWRMWKGT